MNYWAAIWTCASPGEAPTKFCCGYGSESCCNSSFTLGVTGTSFKPGYDAFVQNISAAAASSALATVATVATTAALAQATTSATTSSNTTNETCSNGDLGTKVGIGVGVPLGVLAFGILTFLFWRECGKRKKNADAAYTGHMTQNGTGGSQIPHYQQSNQQHYQSPVHEDGLGTSYYAPAPVSRRTPDTAYSSQSRPKANPWSPAPTYEAPATNVSPQELPNTPNRI